MEVEDQEKNPTFDTFDGVSVEIVKVANSSLFRLNNVKGGVLAEALRGMWTTPQKAKEALDDYNSGGLKAIELKRQEEEAKEQAVKDLLVATPTTENYAKQRIETLKQEKQVANG